MHFSDIGRTWRYLKRNGFRETRNAALERLHEKDDYRYQPPTNEELERQSTEADSFGVTVSIIVPAYETKPEYITGLVESVAEQTYRKWELIIADAGEGDKVYRAVTDAAQKCGLDTVSDADDPEKIRSFRTHTLKYISLGHNDGIAANTNAALQYACGDYVSFLDHDDVLTADAVWRTAQAAAGAPGAAVIYSDEDKMDSAGHAFSACNDKCGWNLDMFLSNNYICHLMTVRRDILDKVQLRSEYDGAQDYDLILQIVSLMLRNGITPGLMGKSIVHIPYVLYHWRVHQNSTAGNTASKTYAYEAGRRALEDFYTSAQIQAAVRHSRHLGFYETEFLPNVFSARTDIAIVCGRVFGSDGRIDSYMADPDGKLLYKGMKDGESGHMHRFDTAQDVGTADLRCMRLRRSLWEDFAQVMGVPYSEDPGTGLWDYDGWVRDYSDKHDGTLPDTAEYSARFSDHVRSRGFLILYSPKLKKILTN